MFILCLFQSICLLFFPSFLKYLIFEQSTSQVMSLYQGLPEIYAESVVYLGVVQNYHHFHERTLGGGGSQGSQYAFLNVVYGALLF